MTPELRTHLVRAYMSGWDDAINEVIAHIEGMALPRDTRDSFLIYFKALKENKDD